MRTALFALVLTAAPVAAQERVLPATGTELFRGVLHRLGYTPVTGFDDGAKVLIVVGPPGRYPPEINTSARKVRASGGSVMLAVNSYPWLRGLFPEQPQLRTRLLTHIQDGDFSLDGGGLVSVLKPGDSPLALPARVTTTGRHALDGISTQTRWSRVALNGPDTVAVAADRPGRVVVVSDESLVTNRMIAGRFSDGTDTGNLEFAVNVARWLKPPGDGPVPCLFLDHGEIVDRFDDVYSAALVPSMPPIGPPPLSAFLEPEAQAKLADAANEAFDRVQTDDRFNSILTRGQRYPRTVQWLLGVLALLAGVALVRRARAARKPPDPPLPPRPDAAKPLGSFAQRREELLRAGDHTAAIREYLVELFRQYGLPLDEYRHPKRLPKVQADADTRRRLATLWEAAYGPHPISYTRWKELEPMIEAVRADAAAGRWRFGRGRA